MNVVWCSWFWNHI